jgi:hypothetical protein
MKNTLIVLAAWMLFGAANAQKTIEKQLSFSDGQMLALELKFADTIDIQTWNKKEVYAVASVNINNNRDNDAYQTDFRKSDNKLIVSANYQEGYFKKKDSCCCIHSMIVWKIFMPEHTPFSVETIDGNIIIHGKTETIRAKTISGFIDLALDPAMGTDLDMKTISGTLYSNLDIAGNGKTSSFPPRVTDKINNGGIPVQLETISGDIFLRKSKM